MNEDEQRFYHPLSIFINIFLAVLFSLSFKEFYSKFSELIEQSVVFPEFILIFITLIFFIDDGIEAQLLTFNHFKYKRLRRFYIDLFIYNLFYTSILLASKLSKFYFITISIIFVLFYFWSKYSLEEYAEQNEYGKLLKLIKTTCILGFIPFFVFFIILLKYNIPVSSKISIYAVILFLVYYFFYDLFGELLLEDLDFKGTGLFKPVIRYFKRKIC